jgi:hypothetical protein
MSEMRRSPMLKTRSTTSCWTWLRRPPSWLAATSSFSSSVERFRSRAWAQAAEPQHKITEAVECGDRRPEQEQEEPEGPHDPQSRAFAALKREALRRKLAENDMEGGDDDEGDRDGDRMRAGGGERFREAAQQRLDQVRQGGLSDPAERQRRDRDAKLGRCKVGVEIVDGALKGGGVGPACADKLCYTAATDSNEGKFSRDEEAVRENERKYGEYPDQIEHTSIGTRHGLLSGGGAATATMFGLDFREEHDLNARKHFLPILALKS